MSIRVGLRRMARPAFILARSPVAITLVHAAIPIPVGDAIILAHRVHYLKPTDEIKLAHAYPMPTMTFNPVDDASVDRNNPDTKLGTSDTLLAGSTTERYNFYLKFDLSALAGKTTGAVTLKLYQYTGAGSANLYIKKVDDDTWTEEEITWNTKPATSDTLHTFPAGSGAAWREYESLALTQYIAAEVGELTSLAFTGGATSHYRFYRSKEYSAGANKPELIVEYDP